MTRTQIAAVERPRCIYAKPDVQPRELVDRLRKRFDPLYKKVPPHITLVFPFVSRVSVGELEAHLHEAVRSVGRFSITFGACEFHDDYAFLPVLGVLSCACRGT